MPVSKKLTILITGCSAGGMGAALALAFHRAGHHVYATGRNPSKLSPLAAQGIQIVTLDVTSTSSIKSAVSTVGSSLPSGGHLDMLINNAASSYNMPISDASLDAARELFNVNVWSHVAVTQAFLPLLLKSTTTTPAADGSKQATIVNHTSVGSRTALPFQGIYNASKAALAMISETMRLELAPFRIQVIDLKTGGVRTNMISNNSFNSKADRLPADSIYSAAREVVEKAMSQDDVREIGITAEQWAEDVAALLLKDNVPAVIWKGESATVARVAGMVPCGLLDGMLKKITKLDVVEDIIREQKR